MTPNDSDSPATVHERNPRNNQTMFQIFDNVQYNVVQHKKYAKEMTKLYRKMEQEDFRESFANALHYMFTFGDVSARVDRVIQFVAMFCTSLDDEEEFLLFIFEIIFNCQCVSGQAVRYRASQLLAAVLAALGDDASLDDDLCDKLLASQMQRLQDTRGAVRCRAALALQRLQNPLDSEDAVTDAYQFHMSCDPSSSVRRAVVMSIAKCMRNLPYVLERLCDVDEAVRRAAFLYVSAITVTQLKIRQRIYTLKVGLTERSVRVKRVVEEILIPNWLSSFEGNIVDLLKAIRLDHKQGLKDSQYVSGKLLESLFKKLPVSELLEWLPIDKGLRLIPAEKLNKETAWYWRHLAQHLQKQEDDETLETILPDLVVLVGYIKAIMESPCPDEKDDHVLFNTKQTVLHELALMLSVYDMGDQVGRATLQQLISDGLTGQIVFNADVIRGFVSALELVIPDVSQRIEFINGVISELREPSEPEPPTEAAPLVENWETKLQRARLRVSLNVAMEAQDEAVREQNYILAAECKAKVEEIQKKLEELNIQPVHEPQPPPQPVVLEKISDSATLNKCLTILNCALDTPQITNLTPLLQSLFTDLQVDIFTNPDLLPNSIETVAMYGLLDKELAKEYRAFFFSNMLDYPNEEVVSKVLKCLIDLLCVHGCSVFDVEQIQGAEDEDQNQSKNKNFKSKEAIGDDKISLSDSAFSMSPSHNTVIELLLKIMDSTDSAYRLIVVEGLCKLLMLGHIESPGILSRLMLLWFNPVTVDEDMLRQVIGVFFQSFVVTVDGAQEQIQKATLPTLRALCNAPRESPIAEIEQEAVVKFIVSLTRVNHELCDSQGDMAVLLCSYLAQRPTSCEAGLICRLLSLLLPPRDATVCSNLVTTLRDVILNLRDKQSSRNLTRYLGNLEAQEVSTINKMSIVSNDNANIEMSVGVENATLSRLGNSSLPQPVARSSTINVTLEKNSVNMPEENLRAISAINRISEVSIEEPSRGTESDDNQNSDGGSLTNDVPGSQEMSSDSSSQGSLVKRPRINRKGLSMRRLNLSNDELQNDKNLSETTQNPTKANTEKNKKETKSQKSLDDKEKDPVNKPRTPAGKAPPSTPRTARKKSQEFNANVTIRKSARKLRSSSSSDSPGSITRSMSSGSSDPKSKNVEKKTVAKTPGNKKFGKKPAKVLLEKKKSVESRASTSSGGSIGFEDTDETLLHTIVYEKSLEQSLLQDSDNEDDKESRSKTGTLTIPETPDTSEKSEDSVEEE